MRQCGLKIKSSKESTNQKIGRSFLEQQIIIYEVFILSRRSLTLFTMTYFPTDLPWGVDYQPGQDHIHCKYFCIFFYDLPAWSNGRVAVCDASGHRLKFCTQQYFSFFKKGDSSSWKSPHQAVMKLPHGKEG